ncbi:hypothetical protein SAMN05660284_00789 [Formivibrio citricus]|uniref:Glycosyltransferase RgtA/B/C/D-like domain-containing protein n=1 Tax=Formivibrio citricus TaxID=83765 RepID=A0A1I4WY78_9NEIS|nr:hypothetical protein [Formivibrio citricus]SFN18385.1 hypothetical protein SAMN05660284_00789 [Formivibrio citricus]
MPAAPQFIAWFLALFAVTQVPLYWVQHPDIMDFPNHLARMHVLMHWSESGILQRYYALRPFQMGTNLAMDIVVPLLAGWMGAALALKLFASFATLLVSSGAVALGRAVTGRVSYLLLGVLLFAHNAMFQMGLFNYLFGLGLAFWLLAAWICARHRAGFWLWMAFAAGCVLIYFCHLSALGVYAVGVLGYELGCARARRGLIGRSTWQAPFLALLQFIPVALLHLLVSNSAGSYVPVPFTGSWLQAALVWFAHKATILALSPSICISGYVLGQSVFGFLLVFALYVGFRERILKLAMPVRWMAGMLALAIIVLPHAGFGSNMVDIRLIPALGLMVWCGLEVGENTRLRPKVVLGVIAVAVALISAETAREWVSRDTQYQRIRTALARISEGATVASVVLDGRSESLSISPHAGAWSIIDRAAFLSNFYIWPFQPFRVAYQIPYVPLAALARTDAPGTSPPTYERLKSHYDYILIFGGNEAKRMRYSPNAEAVFISQSVRLLRTNSHVQTHIGLPANGVTGRPERGAE